MLVLIMFEHSRWLSSKSNRGGQDLKRVKVENIMKKLTSWPFSLLLALLGSSRDWKWEDVRFDWEHHANNQQNCKKPQQKLQSKSKLWKKLIMFKLRASTVLSRFIGACASAHFRIILVVKAPCDCDMVVVEPISNQKSKKKLVGGML